MTNEEKAKLLVGYEIDTPRNLMRMEARDCCDYLISMAKWKDQQFENFLRENLDGWEFTYGGNEVEEFIREFEKSLEV